MHQRSGGTDSCNSTACDSVYIVELLVNVDELLATMGQHFGLKRLLVW